MKLIFATNNEHKLKEIQAILGDTYEILSLDDMDFIEEIPEDHLTFKENALQKAQYIYDKFGINCFADDSGLEIDALNGKPGVFSARFAGDHKNSEDNMDKALLMLQDEDNRKAQFRSVIALIIEGNPYLFEGIIEGNLLKNRKGAKGFGYDPIFVPKGYDETFAQLDSSEKNKISHRARALKKLVSFLNNL